MPGRVTGIQLAHGRLFHLCGTSAFVATISFITVRTRATGVNRTERVEPFNPVAIDRQIDPPEPPTGGVSTSERQLTYRFSFN